MQTTKESYSDYQYQTKYLKSINKNACRGKKGQFALIKKKMLFKEKRDISIYQEAITIVNTQVIKMYQAKTETKGEIVLK